MKTFIQQHFLKLLAAAALFTGTSAYAAQAGHVVFVAGDVAVSGHAVGLDAPVQEGDELTTGRDGYVYVKTVDNGFLILRPNSRARIVAYAVDTQHPANTRVKLELDKGVARSISGQAVKQARQNFRFNTPVAAIGVRGTDFIVYTDDKTSRVTVVSGGIVMSGFGGACSADGTGPCEGGSSRELFAGQTGALLQIERGKAVPQLLNNPALLPDQNEKPRVDEPVGKPATPGSPVADVNLDPQRSSRSLDGVRASAANHPVDPTPPVVVPPPVVVVTPDPSKDPGDTPAKPAPQEIFWGRWQAVATIPAAPGKIGDSGTEAASFAGPYAITRVKNSELVMPREGNASFNLADSEAIVQRNGTTRLGKAESGSLDVNFVDRTFGTALTVKAENDSINLAGHGTISNTGKMLSDSNSSMAIRGYLGGPNAEQAGYVFRSAPPSGPTVSGVTMWTR